VSASAEGNALGRTPQAPGDAAGMVADSNGHAVTTVGSPTSCPQCGASMTPTLAFATTTCQCGLALSTEALKQADYLRYGLPLWADRLSALNRVLDERGSQVNEDDLQEVMTLRRGLPVWREQLATLEQSFIVAAGNAPGIAGGAGVPAANDEAGVGSQAKSPVASANPRGFSPFRLVLALGALMLIAGTTAYSFQLGRAYGPYAQLAALLAVCALTGAGTIYARDRVQATAVAFSAITAGAWFFTMIWFGYKIDGSGFWRFSSPLPVGLAAATAVTFYFAGRLARIGFWTFINRLSSTLTFVLLCFYAAAQWQHLHNVSPAVINSIISLPLSILGVMMLQARLKVYLDQPSARLTSGWVSTGLAAATASVSLIYFLQSANDSQFTTSNWHASALIAWGTHALIVTAVLRTGQVKNLIAEGFTSLAGATLLTSGVAVIDGRTNAPTAGVLVAAAAVTISAAASLLLGRQGSDQGPARAVFGAVAIIIQLSFISSTIDLFNSSYSSAAWCLHMLAIGTLLIKRGRLWPAVITYGVGLGLVGGITCVPVTVAVSVFALGVIAVTFAYPRILSHWALPAVAGLIYSGIYNSQFNGFVDSRVMLATTTTRVLIASALLISAGSVGVLMLRQRKLVAALAGGFLGAQGIHYAVTATGLNGFETWTIPLGMAALIFGYLAWRIQPTLNSLAWLAPAAFICTIPSAIKALTEPPGVRLYFVVAAAITCLVIGLFTDLAGLLLPGAITTVMVSLQPLVQGGSGGSPFISLLIGGSALISVGWKFEKLRTGDGLRSLK